MKYVFYFMVMALWLMSSHVFATETKEGLLKGAEQLNKTGLNYYQQGNYSQALKTFQASLAIREKLLGKQHLDTENSYYKIGSIYGYMKDHSKALEYYHKSLEILEKILGKQHLKTATRYYHIAGAYDAMGNHTKALEYDYKALTIREKVLGKRHLDTANSYNNIGVTYSSIGDHAKALEYLLESLTINEKILGKQHLDTTNSYSNIGETYRDIGNYAKALEYGRKALVIREKGVGKQHLDTAISYNNIGGVYRDIGNYTKALEYDHKALAIREKALGKQHPDTATSYNSIGEIYLTIGDYAKALKYSRKALEITKEVLGNQHLDTAGNYNNIGEAYRYMNYHTQALAYHHKALAIREKVLDKQPLDTANSYNNIGLTYRAMGDYNKALAYYHKALAIKEKTLGKQHPDAANSYNNIGAVYGLMGNHVNAYHYAKKAFAIFLQQRNNSFSILTSLEKEQYLTVNKHWIDWLLFHTNNYQQTLLNKNKPKAAKLAQTILNDWLAYKGSILDRENRLIQLARSSKDPAIQKKYQLLVQLKQAYSKLNQNYPQEAEKIATWQQQLKQQEEKVAALEHEITQDDPRSKDEQALQKITSQTIANGLNENKLYIDYGKTNDDYYLFTIDHKNHISFTAFNKKDSKAIDQQLASFGNDIETIESIDNDERIPENLLEKSKASLSQLYQLLIPPVLAEKIARKNSLIISPDAGLRLLPFEALYDKKEKQYLIEQKDIRYIASGKELVRLFRQQQKSKNNKAVLFANPDFGAEITQTSQSTRSAIYTHNTQRGTLRSDIKRNGFSSLAGTKIEAEAIIKILQKDNTSEPDYYGEKRATEANLLAIKQPNIFHIATHGFFDIDKPNPMLQSGLAFAGANVGVKNGTGEGIITALDLSGLDLKGTDLVVLSACDTGKVDPNNTNGVSGLTKAFIQAGAKNVVMSLWKVSDKETADLMPSFYQNSKDNKGQYSNALKQTKLAMIKKGLHPYYWAAFVLSGL